MRRHNEKNWPSFCHGNLLWQFSTRRYNSTFPDAPTTTIGSIVYRTVKIFSRFFSSKSNSHHSIQFNSIRINSIGSVQFSLKKKKPEAFASSIAFVSLEQTNIVVSNQRASKSWHQTKSMANLKFIPIWISSFPTFCCSVMNLHLSNAKSTLASLLFFNIFIGNFLLMLLLSWICANCISNCVVSFSCNWHKTRKHTKTPRWFYNSQPKEAPITTNQTNKQTHTHFEAPKVLTIIIVCCYSFRLANFALVWPNNNNKLDASQ